MFISLCSSTGGLTNNNKEVGRVINVNKGGGASKNNRKQGNLLTKEMKD